MVPIATEAADFGADILRAQNAAFPAIDIRSPHMGSNPQHVCILRVRTISSDHRLTGSSASEDPYPSSP